MAQCIKLLGAIIEQQRREEKRKEEEGLEVTCEWKDVEEMEIEELKKEKKALELDIKRIVEELAKIIAQNLSPLKQNAIYEQDK